MTFPNHAAVLRTSPKSGSVRDFDRICLYLADFAIFSSRSGPDAPQGLFPSPERCLFNAITDQDENHSFVGFRRTVVHCAASGRNQEQAQQQTEGPNGGDFFPPGRILQDIQGFLAPVLLAPIG
jgi:hypothetical protein